MELAIFRLVQESLTNIHRHSGSKTATIRLARERERVCLEVRDQGKGMPPERLAEIQAQGSGVEIRGNARASAAFQWTDEYLAYRFWHIDLREYSSFEGSRFKGMRTPSGWRDAPALISLARPSWCVPHSVLCEGRACRIQRLRSVGNLYSSISQKPFLWSPCRFKRAA